MFVRGRMAARLIVLVPLLLATALANHPEVIAGQAERTKLPNAVPQAQQAAQAMFVPDDDDEIDDSAIVASLDK